MILKKIIILKLAMCSLHIQLGRKRDKYNSLSQN